MRSTAIGIALILTSNMVLAQPADVDGAIRALNNATKEKIDWNTAQAKTADVTCDGKPDTILFGTNRSGVWVGVVSGSGSKPMAEWFPINGAQQAGFCSRPKQINIYPLSCDTDEMGHLDGCKESKTCKSFSVDDEDCDPFNFYWDNKRHRLSWWRN